jgi:hypothetical protein
MTLFAKRRPANRLTNQFFDPVRLTAEYRPVPFAWKNFSAAFDPWLKSSIGAVALEIRPPVPMI